MIQVKRIYEPFEKADGYRVLVDRLWPRGFKKDEANIDEWAKEIAPSAGLRKWFNHHPENWQGFKTGYTAELKENEKLAPFVATITKHKKVTLLYSAKDEQHNQAIALKDFLDNEVK